MKFVRTYKACGSDHDPRQKKFEREIEELGNNYKIHPERRSRKDVV
jgi:hypothetical protein